MHTIVRGVGAAVLVALTVGRGAVAGAESTDQQTSGRRALYVAGAVAANALPVASSLVEEKCLPGYIFCKLTFAAFSVVTAGESLLMSGGSDLDQPHALLYRGFSGDWFVTPKNIARETNPDLLPEPPPPADQKKTDGFVPPPR